MTVTQQINPKSTLSANIIISLVLLILTGLLWLPFGLNVTCTLDAWQVMAGIEAGLPWVPASRPLLPLPFLIGYWLTPGSFAGLNISLALQFWLKAWLFFVTLRQFRIAHGFAFAAAAIMLLSPIDPLFFYLSSFNIHTAIIFYLLALNGLLWYWKSRRPLALAPMWIGLIFCVLTYELLYPIIFITPLLLFARGARLNRRFFNAAAQWLIVPLFALGRVALVAFNSPIDLRYQSQFVASAFNLVDILRGVANVYAHTLIGGWGMSLAPAEPAFLGIALIAAALVGGITLWLLRREAAAPPDTRSMITAGMAIIVAGILIFVPTTLLYQLERIYFIPAFGGALIFCAVCAGVSRKRLHHRFVFAFLVSLPAALGSLQLLEQHRWYVNRTEAQQRVLLQIAQTIPRPVSGSAILVIDETPDRALGSIFASTANFIFPFVATYTYGDYDLYFSLCYREDTGADSDNRCIFADEYVSAAHVEWVRRSDRALLPYQSYANAIILRYRSAEQGFVIERDITQLTNSDQARALYAPDQRLIAASPLPVRIYSEFRIIDKPK